MRLLSSLTLLVIAGCATTAEQRLPAADARISVPAWVEGPIDESATISIAKPPATAFTTKTLGEAPYSGGAKKKYVGRRIDLDVVNADLHEVCRLLAEVGKIDIVVADDVKGAVTIKMKHVPWDQALDAILRAKGYAAERDGGVVTVYAP